MLKNLSAFKIFSLIAISLALSIFSQRIFGLGFGEIQLLSYINEPLQAEIELLGAEGLDPQRIMVSLASTQEFKRANLDRPFFLSQLKFNVTRSGPKTLIQVTSEQPIRQAYLDFLIDLTSPEGRLLRGYTILLDPPPAGRVAPLTTTRQNLENLFDPQDLDQSIKIEEPMTPMTVVAKVTTQNALQKQSEIGENQFSADTQNEPTKTNERSKTNAQAQAKAKGNNFKNPDHLNSGKKDYLKPLKILKRKADVVLTTWKISYPELMVLLGGLSSLIISFVFMFYFIKSRRKNTDNRNNNSLSTQIQTALTSTSIFSASELSAKQNQVWAEEADPAELQNPLTKPFANEMSMKLDLAKQYREVGETTLALPLLDDVILRGSIRQREEATQLLQHILQQETAEL